MHFHKFLIIEWKLLIAALAARSVPAFTVIRVILRIVIRPAVITRVFFVIVRLFLLFLVLSSVENTLLLP